MVAPAADGSSAEPIGGNGAAGSFDWKTSFCVARRASRLEHDLLAGDARVRRVQRHRERSGQQETSAFRKSTHGHDPLSAPYRRNAPTVN
jgi:hypothetical protein